MSADGGSRNEAQSHCLHRNTLYSENTQKLYVLLFIRNVVQTLYIKCESLKPNFTFLVILFACLMWHIYQSFAVTSLDGY